jgi:hypothetical protein
MVKYLVKCRICQVIFLPAVPARSGGAAEEVKRDALRTVGQPSRLAVLKFPIVLVLVLVLVIDPLLTSPKAPGLARFRGPAIDSNKCRPFVFLRPGRAGLR